MTAKRRNQAALIMPVSRNIVTPHVNARCGLPLTSPTVVEMTARPIRKGHARQKIGMWGTISMDYKTAATIDRRWDRTVTDPVT